MNLLLQPRAGHALLVVRGFSIDSGLEAFIAGGISCVCLNGGNSSDGVGGIVLAPFVSILRAGAQKERPFCVIDSLRFASPVRGLTAIE